MNADRLLFMTKLRERILAAPEGKSWSTREAEAVARRLRDTDYPHIQEPEANVRCLMQRLRNAGYLTHDGRTHRWVRTSQQSLEVFMAKKQRQSRKIRSTRTRAKPTVDFAKIAPRGCIKDAPVNTFDSTSQRGSVRLVPTSKMYIPPYHGVRDPNNHPVRVRALLAHLKAAGNQFSPLRCEVLTVALMPDGRYAIIDGGGRFYMATQMVTPPIAELQCRVLTDMSEDDQIALYKAFLKERTKGRKLDEWLADRPHNDDIDAMMTWCENFEFKIVGSRGTGDKGLTISLNAVQLAFGLGVLETTLARIVNTEWRDSPMLTSGHIAAIAVLLSLGANTKRLGLIMNANKPGAIHQKAFSKARDMEIAKPQPRHIAWMIADELVELYNHGFRSGGKLKHADLIFESEFNDVYWPYPPKIQRRDTAIAA